MFSSPGSVRYDAALDAGDDAAREKNRRRTVGKVIIAKQKWDEKKKAQQLAGN